MDEDKFAACDLDHGGHRAVRGAVRPEEPLSGFAGENQEGRWALRVADTAAGDTGTVGCVQLRIRSA
jgi:subtilisin-like proprotein convertase family protein